MFLVSSSPKPKIIRVQTVQIRVEEKTSNIKNL